MGDGNNLEILCDNCDKELETNMIFNNYMNELDTIIDYTKTSQTKEIDKEIFNNHHHQHVIHRKKSFSIKLLANRTNHEISVETTEEEFFTSDLPNEQNDDLVNAEEFDKKLCERYIDISKSAP